MESNIDLRKLMLDVVKNSLEGGGDKFIHFFEGTTELCTVGFNTLEVTSAPDEKASYIFKNLDGSTELKGIVGVSGTVDNFEINGTNLPELNGTVGNVGSSADIKFSAIIWYADATVVTLTDLKVTIPQGT